MKRFYICFIALMEILPHLGAQEKLQKCTNMPRPGDGIFKQQVEYKHPGKSGMNVFWNFGKLNTVDKKYKITYSNEGTTVHDTTMLHWQDGQRWTLWQRSIMM